jgi:uncharacterized protein
VRPAVHGLLFDRPQPYYMMQFAGAARGDDWFAMAKQNATMGALWMLGGNVLWYVPWLLGRFLAGYVVGAKRWFEGPRVEVFRKVLVVGVAVAVPGLVFQILQMLKVVELRGSGVPVKAVLAVVQEITTVAQVAVYVAAVVLLVQRSAWRRLLGILAPVGRMPLTTYLMQSAICPVLFYGWGLGWRTPGPAASVGLACAIFVGQVVFAHLWLRWFRFGPAEWLWRTVVYLRAQPMRA